MTFLRLIAAGLILAGVVLAGAYVLGTWAADDSRIHREDRP